MPNEEYEIAKKERDRKDKLTSIIVVSMMSIGLIGGLVFIVVTR